MEAAAQKSTSRLAAVTPAAAPKLVQRQASAVGSVGGLRVSSPHDAAEREADFLPGGNLVTRALDTYGVFAKAGAFIEQRMAWTNSSRWSSLRSNHGSAWLDQPGSDLWIYKSMRARLTGFRTIPLLSLTQNTVRQSFPSTRE